MGTAIGVAERATIVSNVSTSRSIAVRILRRMYLLYHEESLSRLRAPLYNTLNMCASFREGKRENRSTLINSARIPHIITIILDISY